MVYVSIQTKEQIETEQTLEDLKRKYLEMGSLLGIEVCIVAVTIKITQM